MKVLITTGLFPPDIGGPATYSKLLENNLPERGIDVRILSFGEVRRLPKIIRHFVYFIKVILRSRGCDIVFVQDPVSVGFPSYLASKITSKKFILKVVGDYAWEQGVQRYGVSESLDEFSAKTGKYPIAVNVLKRTERFVAEGAYKIIVPSKYLKRIVANWGVGPEKIEVIYNGLAQHESMPTQGTIRQVLKFEGKLLISAGRLVPWKGFAGLIEAMPPLVEKFPGIKLLIVGSGPEKKNIEKLINELNLSGSVVLTGSLPKDILLKYVKASDIFILNTSYEGFSHQLLEVMSIGVPIITTSAGGNTEIIKDNRNGILVSYNNKDGIRTAIKKILNNPSVGEKLSRAAITEAKKFSMERMIEETVSVIKNTNDGQK